MRRGYLAILSGEVHYVALTLTHTLAGVGGKRNTNYAVYDPGRSGDHPIRSHALALGCSCYATLMMTQRLRFSPDDTAHAVWSSCIMGSAM